jgi:hypothetical protein
VQSQKSELARVFDPGLPVPEFGRSYRLRIVGKEFLLKPKPLRERTVVRTTDRKFLVADWTQQRFGVGMDQQFPVWPKDSENQSKERKGGRSLSQVPGDSAVVMFSKYTTWAMMQPGYEAEHYARDLRASQAEGEENETWFALRLPVQGQDVPEWEANFYYAVKRLHQLFRLRGYPKSMNHRSLDNLAVLLSTNRDYFFTTTPLRCGYSDRAIIAFSLD